MKRRKILRCKDCQWGKEAKISSSDITHELEGQIVDVCFWDPEDLRVVIEREGCAGGRERRKR